MAGHSDPGLVDQPPEHPSIAAEPFARGLGFTVLPRFAVTAFAQQEKIRVIQSSIEVIDTLWLIYRAEWPLPARHQRLVSVLKKRVAAH